MNYLSDDELRNTVHNDILNPNIKLEIENLLNSRNIWRKVSNITETSGNLMIVVATILAFSSGVYKDIVSLSFVAGCSNVLSLSLLKFSEYAIKESEERNKLLNDLLNGIKLYQEERNVINTTPITFY